MSNILLIDDEKLPMDYYIRAFKMRSCSVKQYLDPDSVLDYVKNKKPHLDAIVLDIMMLPGQKYIDEDTNNGLKTGILLYKDLRAFYPKTPVIFLTNVSNPDIPTLPNETQATLVVAQKIDYPPFELVDLVESMIADVKNLEKA